MQICFFYSFAYMDDVIAAILEIKTKAQIFFFFQMLGSLNTQNSVNDVLNLVCYSLVDFKSSSSGQITVKKPLKPEVT